MVLLLVFNLLIAKMVLLPPVTGHVIPAVNCGEKNASFPHTKVCIFTTDVDLKILEKSSFIKNDL